MTYALRRKRNRVFDRLENWDARFYKKPGFCVQEDHDLRTPTKETGFLTVWKTGMQDFYKKPGFCVQAILIHPIACRSAIT
jgi:hypothetical protein